MSRLTITLSNARHKALKEASVQCDKAIGQLVEESLDFHGIKARKEARSRWLRPWPAASFSFFVCEALLAECHVVLVLVAAAPAPAPEPAG
jgi:hypothetical protein